ncbi:MAG: FAD-dependent oxidoreductase [Actinomycetota bacterium]
MSGAELPGRPSSLWLETSPPPAFEQLPGDLEVDVVVIGAGIAGLTTAYLLKAAGKKVAVLEARRVCGGVTGHTTAKVTSQHGLIYADLVKRVGEEGASIYARSNEAALRFIVDLVERSGIGCDLEPQQAYTYTEDPQELDPIKEEVQIAESLGLPATYVTETDLPYDVVGAVRFDGQAQFHPVKYLTHLARSIPGDGSHIFEDTRVTDLEEGDVAAVGTEHGRVRAGAVVVATNMPIFDRGLFFAKVHPQRSYVVTARWDGADELSGMYISVGGSTRSIRVVKSTGDRLLMIGGAGHKTGQDLDTPARYRELEEFARERFGVTEFVHRWSTQDCTSVDKVPYIGRLRRSSDNVHVATGFGKWGMTNGTLSGMIISNAILGEPDSFASLYDAKRINPGGAAREFVKENVNVAQRWVGDRLSHPQSTAAEELTAGSGGIIDAGLNNKIAAFKDEEGALHTFSAVCTHLGCQVRWNDAEMSFDCPCHGSRFDRFGRVIQGPATRDLDPTEL